MNAYNENITLVDAQGRTWKLRAPTPVQANNWGVAIETRTGCEAVGKHTTSLTSTMIEG